MRSTKPVSANRYLYASGRIRALEIQLLDSGRLNRLHEARTIDEINRILTESGYPAASDPETRLSREIVAAYQLMQTLFVEPAYMEILLLFHDFHNLKVILKTLTPAWPHRPNADHAVADDLPEASGPYSLLGPSALDPLFRHPSLVDPHILFSAVRDRQAAAVPAWLYGAAVQAVRRYQQSYDVSDIDQYLDRTASGLALAKADQIGNLFFSQYLRLQSDLTNLGLLLRTRLLRSGTADLEHVLLPGGSLPVNRMLDLYGASTEQIKAAYASTPVAALAALADEYGQPGSAGRFSRLADNLVIGHIRQARGLWRGPEILLAYLIGREMEIKNIRIALTCLRNGLPSDQAREMSRDSYLTWR